jgi:hypothetical protein
MFGDTGSNRDVRPESSSHWRHGDEKVRLGGDAGRAQDDRRLDEEELSPPMPHKSECEQKC